MKKCLLTTLIVFFVLFGLEMLIHEVLLKGDYALTAHLYRSPEEIGKHFPYMVVAYLIMAKALVWIYGQGKKDSSPVGQGIRFGLAIAAVSTIPTVLIYYAVMPISCSLAGKQLLFGVLEMLVLGVVIAHLKKCDAAQCT